MSMLDRLRAIGSQNGGSRATLHLRVCLYSDDSLRILSGAVLVAS